MEAADLLCNSLFLWMKNRKKCAEKLLELAQELENVHQGSTSSKVAGDATSVAAITGAIVPGDVTGDMVPLLALKTVDTVGTSPLVDAGISSSTFNKATELIKEDEKVGTGIQKQLQDLKAQCGGAQLGAHADELEREVTSLLMCALARRKNTHVPLDFLRGFNRATFFPGGMAPDKASRLICRALGLYPVPVINSILKVLDAIGSDRSLSNLIVLVERKQISEASKILWDSARDILEGQQELKKQLDAMHEIIQKLFRMKNLITDLRGYSLRTNENGHDIMECFRGTSTDNTVVSRFEEATQFNDIIKLLEFFLGNLDPILEDLTRPGGGDIDIVFFAHGSIVNQFMPAGVLVPTPNITDTILYSPWNCKIDSSAAFAIAQGNIDMTNRQFYNRNGNGVYYEPNPLPDHWNSMRGSLHNIPVILLSPLTPEEEADRLRRDTGIEGRVVIPYLVQQNQERNTIGEIPLSIFISAISAVLEEHDKTATVHLAANLTRRTGSPLMPEEWRRQYAYTSDGTIMTVNMNATL